MENLLVFVGGHMGMKNIQFFVDESIGMEILWFFIKECLGMKNLHVFMDGCIGEREFASFQWEMQGNKNVEVLVIEPMEDDKFVGFIRGLVEYENL